MYANNFLAKNLRSASAGRDNLIFAQLPDGRTVSYTEFFSAAEGFAKLLIAKGVKPGDRVAVQVDKSIEVLELYIGTVLAGAVFLPLNTAYTAGEIHYFLEDASPSMFVCRSTVFAEMEPIALKSGITAVETLDADGSGSLCDSITVDDTPFTAVAREADDLAAILYTSGTTGRSKGAMLSHNNLSSNAKTLMEFWMFSQEDVLIHALPVFHVHGLFVAVNVTLAAGASMILIPGFDSDRIVNAMPRATVLMGVPTYYVRLLDHKDLSREATAAMRLFISGSAPLLKETHKLWREKTGHAILERYGMTETNMITSNPYQGDRKPGTVGLPLPGVEVQIVDPDNGQAQAVNQVGSIEVRGPNVFQGYWQMPEKTREELRENGFFITGDLGLVDDQGYVSIIGRSKDLIISGGYNVYPKEVELLIDEIEGVDESAVIGVEHRDFGEAVVAIVVLQKSVELTSEDIKTALFTRLAKFKQPKKVYFVEELPRNTMGKVQKNSLRDTYKACCNE